MLLHVLKLSNRRKLKKNFYNYGTRKEVHCSQLGCSAKEGELQEKSWGKGSIYLDGKPPFLPLSSSRALGKSLNFCEPKYNLLNCWIETER